MLLDILTLNYIHSMILRSIGGCCSSIYVYIYTEELLFVKKLSFQINFNY